MYFSFKYKYCIQYSRIVLHHFSKRTFLENSKCLSIFRQQSFSEMTQFKYPEVRRIEDNSYVDFGIKHKDPYRWLEDVDSEETKKFVADQNALSEPYIKSCSSRESIVKRLKELFEYPRYGCPFKKGNNYFMYINSGLQNQSVLYIMRGDLNAEKEIFLDPNLLSEDGTVSLAAYTNKFSHDGKYFAYGLSKSGSDWINLKIKDVETGKDLDEELIKLKFSTVSWTLDNKGFFYSCYPNNADKCDGTETTDCTFQKMYYHKLNTLQSSDILVYEDPDHPHYRFTSTVSDCGYYLHVFTIKSCEYNLWHYFRFEDPLNPKIEGKLELTPFIEEYNADYYYVANDGPVHYIRTNRNASNYRLVSIDLTDSNSLAECQWKDLIKEHSKNVLETVKVVRKDILVCDYISDVISRIHLHSISDGSLIKELDLPVGAVTSINCERDHDELFYSFTSFLTPGIIFTLKLDKNLEKSPTIFKEVKPNNFDSSNFVTKQEFYLSKDGTRIPLFLVHHKDLVRDGTQPCLLYAYGGFNISVQPYFSVQRLILMDNLKGVFALANIRGGGEYGEQWHNGGKLLNKQNCFDDFIAAGEYLVKEKYTSTEKLIIQGGSNGGLLVGAVSNQRPDLFGCSIAHVGVMDMLRYHKFTIGHAWMDEYGDPDKEEHFRNLIRLSPLHSVPDSTKIKHYPATLLLTADHDDRVVPLHSFKLIAELQYKLGKAFPDIPLMIRIETKAGHGFGKPTEKIIQEMADIYSFIINSLKLEYK